MNNMNALNLYCQRLTQVLLEREVIYTEDVERIFGKRQWTSRSDEILNENEAKKSQSEPDKPNSEQTDDELLTKKEQMPPINETKNNAEIPEKA